MKNSQTTQNQELPLAGTYTDHTFPVEMTVSRHYAIYDTKNNTSTLYLIPTSSSTSDPIIQNNRGNNEAAPPPPNEDPLPVQDLSCIGTVAICCCVML